MSLGGGTTRINNEEPRVLSLRVNQSAYGLAIPRIWGTQRVPSNLLWYGDFNPIAHTTTQSSGGKGGNKVESSSTTWTYTAAMALALCSGTIAGIGTIWKDKTQTTLAGLGLGLFNGALGQAVWSHLSANHPTEAVGYSGIAYVAASSFDLGDSPSTPALNYEVQGERIIPGGNGDAAPADIITDIITDPVEGLGRPSSILADLTDYRAWCVAMGLTLSLAATAQQPSRDYLTQVLQATMADSIWSQGQIKVIPYGDQPVNGWTPNTTITYNIDEGDLLSAPIHRRKQPSEAINRVTVTYSDRSNDYNTVPVTRDDLSAVTQFGARPKSIDLPAITTNAMAVAVCEFWRDRELYIRNSYELSLDERFCLLEPMDLITLTFAPQALDHVPLVVVEITETEDGGMTVLAEEWPFGIATPSALNSQSTSGYAPEQAIAPGSVNTPVILEAPNIMTAPNLEIWIGASGGLHWGGCNVWVSDDNATYQQVGTITSPARQGVLTSSLPSGADPDVTNTLYVDLTACRGQLISGTQADADNLNTLCWVDGEMLAYETATLTTQYKYAATYLRRGAKGTTIAGHSTAAQFLRIDDAVFRYVVPRERIGRTIWIKLQSFNQFGLSPEPLDTLTAYSHTVQGNTPAAPASLTATGGLFENRLAWTFVAGQVGRDYVELWGATTNDRSQALLLSSLKNPTTSWKHVGLAPGATWYYWIRIIDTSGNPSAFYPAGATAGIAGTPSSDPSYLLTQLQGALGVPQLANDLAQPIIAAPGQIEAQALAALQSALDDYDLQTRMRWQETVTNATITIDSVSGRIQLLATAQVTTDVETRLTAVEVTANADHGTLTSTVATLTSVQGDLSSAQSQITSLSNSVALKASQVYVDNAVAGATGALTVTAANNAQLLALTALQEALDEFTNQQSTQTLTASVALAQTSIQANATALAAEAAARSALVATVAGNIAAVTTEQLARASGDAANASSIAAVSARLDTGDYAAVKTQASATASAMAGVQAKYAVKVDANGHVVGFELISDGTISTFGILADKFLVYKPDGTGGAVQVFTLGTVNGVTALALAGSLIADGMILGRHISASQSIDAPVINGGQLNATTGTFAGALSGATGTFSGSLTAAAVNAVDTLNLKGQAVTLEVVSTGSAFQALNNFVTAIFTQSVSLGTINLTSSAAGGAGGCTIIFSCDADLYMIFDQTGGPAGQYCTFEIQKSINGGAWTTVMAGSPMAYENTYDSLGNLTATHQVSHLRSNFAIYDSSGAGNSVSYRLYVNAYGGTNWYGKLNVGNWTAIFKETKR